MTDNGYIVVPDAVREDHRKPRYANNRTAALREGKTIFVPGAWSPGGTLTVLKREGLRIVTRRTSVDGVKGTLAWAEPL